MYVSPETLKLIFDLGIEQDKLLSLFAALERDAQAVAPPTLISGVNEERERLRNSSTYAERKRAKDRERQTVNRATSWLALREQVFARDDFCCHYCGTYINDEPHCDHVIPFSRGGSNDLNNLVTSCAPCNIAKGDKTPEEWRAAK